MNHFAEERFNLCLCMAGIAKERDNKNKKNEECGMKPHVKLDLFTIPHHTKRMFGNFLKTPKYAHIHTISHNAEPVTCIAIHKNRLYSGHSDGNIRIWNTETRRLVTVLKGHTYYVNDLTVHENKLYCCGMDGDHTTIRIWNTETYEEITTLEGHTWLVRCLTIHENKLYSGSEDNTIRIWNTETHEIIATLEGHTAWVSCFTIHKNRLYSGDRGGTIRIWNTETYEEIANLEGLYNMECLTVHENKLYSGGVEMLCGTNTIRIWSTETLKKIVDLEGVTTRVCGSGLEEHTSSVTCLIIHENKLYSGNGDIGIWNTETHEKITTLSVGHTENNMTCLTHHENKLYSGNDVGNISCWKI